MIIFLEKDYDEDYIDILIFDKKLSDVIEYDSEGTLNCPFLISIKSIFSEASVDFYELFYQNYKLYTFKYN